LNPRRKRRLELGLGGFLSSLPRRRDVQRQQRGSARVRVTSWEVPVVVAKKMEEVRPIWGASAQAWPD
jgi:hypothetical protein